jgi:hypothetical protein
MSPAVAPIHWIQVTSERWHNDPVFANAIRAFRPPDLPAAKDAAHWLKHSAALAAEFQATYIYMPEDDVLAFYSLRTSEVELTQAHRKSVGLERSSHPRQGAVLITWICKAAGAEVEGAEILLHAVGTARTHAKFIGAGVIALDPYDQPTSRMWQGRFRFRRSRTEITAPGGATLHRLWQPLYPA